VYEYVSLPQSVHGRIAFWVRQGTKYFIVNVKGQRGSKGYDEIYRLDPLSGGRAYVIAKNDHAYIKELVHDLFFADGAS